VEPPLSFELGTIWGFLSAYGLEKEGTEVLCVRSALLRLEDELGKADSFSPDLEFFFGNRNNLFIILVLMLTEMGNKVWMFLCIIYI
jgi:hypothetical protein